MADDFSDLKEKRSILKKSMADFENYLMMLSKVTDASAQMNALIHIRTAVDWPKGRPQIEVLCEKNNYMRDLITCLQSAQKNVVDITLSILGNCCMSRTCAKTLKRHNILPVLNHLLKRNNTNVDSINGRIFRILGNLCHHKEDWPSIIIDRKPQIINYVVDFLKSSVSNESDTPNEGTIVMAIRFVRELLSCYTMAKLVKHFGVLKPLGLLLIEYTKKWNESMSSQTQHTLYNIIKVVYEYSKYNCYQSILDLKTTEQGNALICLSDILLVSPTIIIKTVMNFVQMSQLKSDLPIPEICDGFMTLLEDQKFITEFDGHHIEYIKCLCYLFDHPANRSANRCGKSIPVLIDALKNLTVSDTSLTCSILIIASLSKCKYNDALIKEQLKYDILQVITEKLHWVVGSSSSLPLKHTTERKRKYDSKPVSDFSTVSSLSTLKQPLSSPSSSDDEEILRPTYSPGSSSDSDLSSLLGFSPTRLVWEQAVRMVESDSDNYSPVCSESDVHDFASGSSTEKIRMDFQEVDPDPDEEKYLPSMDSQASPTTWHLNCKLTVEIVRLLKIYAKIDPPCSQLASVDLLLALIKCSIYFGTMVSSRLDTLEVVCRILEHYDFLLPLMQTEFIPTVYELTNPQHGTCVKCNQFHYIGTTVLRRFTYLAESAVGKGNVAHQLLRASDDVKRKLTLVVPYVIKNKSTLSKLMVGCGGLEILMTMFKDSDEFQGRSIKVLCVLASKKLGISNPKRFLCGEYKDIDISDKYQLDESCTTVVTFKLDNGDLVKADRRFLCAKSDYFNSLLNGKFKEAVETEIRLYDVESKPLHCLLQLLQIEMEKTDTVELDLELNTLLDTIALCDKYLLTDLCVVLTSCVEQFKMSPETIPIIYQWSIVSGTNLLRVESIAYSLVDSMADADRLTMFNNLFQLGYLEELITDIKKLLLCYLNRS